MNCAAQASGREHDAAPRPSTISCPFYPGVSHLEHANTGRLAVWLSAQDGAQARVARDSSWVDMLDIQA